MALCWKGQQRPWLLNLQMVEEIGAVPMVLRGWRRGSAGPGEESLLGLGRGSVGPVGYRSRNRGKHGSS